MLIFVLAFGFFLAALVGVLFVAPEHAVPFISHPSSLIQLATCFSALAMALVLRRIKVSTFMIMFGSRGPDLVTEHGPQVSAYGKTIAVALEDRGAA